MAVSTKRTRSELGLDALCSPVKRRSFTLGGPPFRLTGRRHEAQAAAAFVPRLRTSTGGGGDGDGGSSSSGNANEDVEPAVIEARKRLNKDLLLAVSRCSDSDMGSGTDWENSREINDSRKKSVSSRPSSFSSKRNQAPKVDLMARERCFDYIVQSIDEVWARYCDTTSNAEAAVYGDVVRGNKKGRQAIVEANKPPFYTHLQRERTLRISDSDGASSDVGGSEMDDDDTIGGRFQATVTTDCETDHSDSRTVSNLPDSVKLQSLKSRLTKAKHDLEQVYDSTEFADGCAFWRRWDMIKYSAVEMMEEDDDDEIIESVIEELEQGRCYIN